MKSYEDLELRKKLKSLREIRNFLEKNRYIKSNKIVGELGEHFSCSIMSLALNMKSNEKGYDAIDEQNGEKYEIKTLQIHENNKNRSTYSLKNLDIEKFDYLLLVVLNDDYWIEEIWKLNKEDIKITPSKSIDINKVRKSKAEKVYP